MKEKYIKSTSFESLVTEIEADLWDAKELAETSAQRSAKAKAKTIANPKAVEGWGGANRKKLKQNLRFKITITS